MLEYGVINDRAPHIIADLCEIACFFEERPVSRSDIEGFITTRGGAGLISQLERQEDTGAENNERMQRLTEDAFKHLMYRSTAFGEWYPFRAQHDVLELAEPETIEHQIYVNLLCHSRLKMFKPARRAKLASEFEVLCCFAMRALFPDWNVYHFGAGGCDRHLFGNKFSDAICALAKKLRDEVHAGHVAKISPHDVGDGGIDIVALHEWNDPAEAVPAFFAQCAAQQEGWPEKRFEAHPMALEKYIHFFYDPSSVLFIPLCYRGPDGQWLDASGHNSLLVDRLRLVEQFKKLISKDEDIKDELLKAISEPFIRGVYNLEVIEAAA